MGSDDVDMVYAEANVGLLIDRHVYSWSFVIVLDAVVFLEPLSFS